MNNLQWWLGLVLVSAAVTAVAVQPGKAFSEKQLAQQQRMTDCAAEARQKALKANARMAFMKTCLAGGQVMVELGGEAAASPEDKAKDCEAQVENGCLAE